MQEGINRDRISVFIPPRSLQFCNMYKVTVYAQARMYCAVHLQVLHHGTSACQHTTFYGRHWPKSSSQYSSSNIPKAQLALTIPRITIRTCPTGTSRRSRPSSPTTLPIKRCTSSRPCARRRFRRSCCAGFRARSRNKGR